MKIILSNPSQRDAILTLHQDAFGTKAGSVISALVADLFEDDTAQPLLSLVARDATAILGHVLFTRALIRETPFPASAMLLAPLAVSPAAQNRGIGQALIREGLQQLVTMGVNLVFVLGHPGYYPKAGFTPAGVHHLFAPYPIPEKDAGAWMVKELGTGFLGRVRGRVQCASALDRPEHWRE